MGRTAPNLRFLVLGSSPQDATNWPHPVTISVHPARAETRINFSVGHHIVNAGGQVGIGTVVIGGELNEAFGEEFDATESRWLVPYLARLAEGEDVTATELSTAYTDRFGSGPAVEFAPRYP